MDDLQLEDLADKIRAWQINKVPVHDEDPVYSYAFYAKKLLGQHGEIISELVKDEIRRRKSLVNDKCKKEEHVMEPWNKYPVICPSISQCKNCGFYERRQPINQAGE